MSRRTGPVMLFCLSSVVVMMLVAVSAADAQRSEGEKVQAPRAGAKGEVLADVNGVPITKEEIEKALAVQLSKLEEQIYTLKKQRLEAMIVERLIAKEAAKRGVSEAALLDVEVTSKVGLVTEQEIDAFYQANKIVVKDDDATRREQVRSRLQSQKIAAQREAFVKTLRSQAKVAVYLTPPPVHRIEVNVDGAPFVGAADAPVTVVEFSDFHCPFCQRAEDTIGQILSRYGDRVRLIWRDYPIDNLHPQARKAHEAARCASDQGKFWPYHKALFAGPPKQPEQLPAVAQETGLDMASFKACVASGKHQAAVQKDVEEGKRLDVTGTPTFFINGRALSGAQALEAFVRVIDDELARSKPMTAKPVTQSGGRP